MPVLVTSKFDKVPIKNERKSKMETPFSHYRYMGISLDAQGDLTPSGVIQSGRNSNMSSLPASLRRLDQN